MNPASGLILALTVFASLVVYFGLEAALIGTGYALAGVTLFWLTNLAVDRRRRR